MTTVGGAASDDLATAQRVAADTPTATTGAAPARSPRPLKLIAAVSIPVALVVWPYVSTDRLLASSIAIIVLGLFAMSLDLVLGYGGLATLGQALFFGIGGYAAGILAVRVSDQLIVTLPAAMALGGIAGYLVARLALRTKALQFLLITFAISGIGLALIARFPEYTGGNNGLAAIPDATIFGVAIDTPMRVYYLAVVVLAASWFVMYRIVHSAFGRVIIGIRDNATRVQALGVNPTDRLALLFAIAGSFSAAAGAVHSYWYNFISPEAAGFALATDGLFMVIIGGVATLGGALIGAVFIQTAHDRLPEFTDYPNLVLGVIFIAFILFVPGGILASVRRGRARFGAGRAHRGELE